MNTDQINEMVTAITEGKPYAHKFESAGLDDDMTLKTSGEKLLMCHAESRTIFGIDDAETAHDIATALLAFSRRKLGIARSEH